MTVRRSPARRAAIPIALLVAGTLLGVVVWTAWIWWRTPGIVEAAEASIAAPFDPSDLPPGRIEDLLAVEDPAFRTHHGIDLSTPGAGWTTIPQGLAKDLYFDAFRPGPIAKLEQSLAAVVLDARIPKERLLIGTVYLGESAAGPIHGFGLAARVWLGRDVRDLDRREFLSLVAMVVGPNEYQVGSERGAERAARIEQLLAGECRPAGWRDVTYEACAREDALGR